MKLIFIRRESGNIGQRVAENLTYAKIASTEQTYTEMKITPKKIDIIAWF